MNGFKHHVFLDLFHFVPSVGFVSCPPSRERQQQVFFYLLILYSFFVILAQAGFHFLVSYSDLHLMLADYFEFGAEG